jgi:hypothetical protein
MPAIAPTEPASASYEIAAEYLRRHGPTTTARLGLGLRWSYEKAKHAVERARGQGLIRPQEQKFRGRYYVLEAVQP